MRFYDKETKIDIFWLKKTNKNKQTENNSNMLSSYISLFTCIFEQGI